MDKLYFRTNCLEEAVKEAKLWVAMTPPQLNDFTFDPNGILKFQL